MSEKRKGNPIVGWIWMVLAVAVVIVVSQVVAPRSSKEKVIKEDTGALTEQSGKMSVVEKKEKEEEGVNEALDKKPVSTVMAEQLWLEYRDNGIAADARWKGKVIVVVGVIERIGRDAGGTGYVWLKTGKEDEVIRCMFSRTEEESLLKLHRGDEVRIQGQVAGVTPSGGILLRYCKVLTEETEGKESQYESVDNS